MKFYPPKINEKFLHPQNAGKANGANAVGASASFNCGAFIRLSLQIEVKTKEILEAKFKSNGCGFMIAAAEVLTEMIVGKKLVELHGAKKDVLRTDIEAAFGKFPAYRAHCLELCLEALQSAFTDFRFFQLEEFSGEKALICTCFGVSEETIENLIGKNLVETVEEVGAACNAGTGCGSCQFLIQELIDAKYDIFNL